MIRSFLRHYFELPDKTKNIVCLGGGVGTAQILKGLRLYDYNLTAIVSMADDGGSAGRLRRAFSIPPPGDLVNCLAALSNDESIIKKLFLYRFKGKRYGKDTDLGGQKLGNLIFVALADIYKGNTSRALEEFSKITATSGQVLPATLGDVNIWAKTTEGKKVYGEQNIDLGKYNGGRALAQVHLDPANPKAYQPALKAIKNAQIVIIGPGDLFSTTLPVVIVPQIKKELLASTAQKILIVNVANKPFETPRFKVADYLDTCQKHLGKNIFQTMIVNTNQKNRIPHNLKYQYVDVGRLNLAKYQIQVVEGDFVDEKFPIYHDSQKTAQIIQKIIS